jgi:WXXGXW repeat (2 copies)
MLSRLCLSAAMAAVVLAPIASNAQVVVTSVAPPSPITERETAPPGPNYTWVAGYWNWIGSQYQWVAGRWAQTPATAERWDPPRWIHQGERFQFQPGRWRGHEGPTGGETSPVVMPIVAPTAPPPLRIEHRRPSTLDGQRWIPGFWSWSGTQHAWNIGHYETPPTPTSRWTQPRWGHHGRSWTLESGGWH